MRLMNLFKKTPRGEEHIRQESTRQASMAWSSAIESIRVGSNNPHLMDKNILDLLEALGNARPGMLGNEAILKKQIASVGTSAFQLLIEVLNDRHAFGSFVRHGAFKAVCELGDKHTLPYLIAFYQQTGFREEEEERDEAGRLFDAIARIGNATAVDFLIEEIKKLSTNERPVAFSGFTLTSVAQTTSDGQVSTFFVRGAFRHWRTSSGTTCCTFPPKHYDPLLRWKREFYPAGFIIPTGAGVKIR